MRATEFLNYINKKRKPSKDETDEDYTHFTCNEYEWVMEKKMEVINETREALISEVKNDEFKEVGKDPF